MYALTKTINLHMFLSYNNSETEDSLCRSVYMCMFQFLDLLISLHKMFYICVMLEEAINFFNPLKSAWQDYKLMNWEWCSDCII